MAEEPPNPSADGQLPASDVFCSTRPDKSAHGTNLPMSRACVRSLAAAAKNCTGSTQKHLCVIVSPRLVKSTSRGNSAKQRLCGKCLLISIHLIIMLFPFLLLPSLFTLRSAPPVHSKVFHRIQELCYSAQTASTFGKYFPSHPSYPWKPASVSAG